MTANNNNTQEAASLGPDSSVNTTPTQYHVFKGKSAMRLQIEKPTREDQKYKVGCLYMQAAPFKEKVGGNNTYDWENNKISVKFGINDITNINHGFKLGDGIDIFHEFNEVQKIIKFTPKDGGGYFLKITEKSKNSKEGREINIPLSAEETTTVATLFTFAIPLIHNWM